MAQVKGRLSICDRCGKTIFSKVTGEGETDGGYTRWNKFEELPEGWKNYYEVGLLCPDCNAIYHKIIAAFKDSERWCCKDGFGGVRDES